MRRVMILYTYMIREYPWRGPVTAYDTLSNTLGAGMYELNFTEQVTYDADSAQPSFVSALKLGCSIENDRQMEWLLLKGKRY